MRPQRFVSRNNAILVLPFFGLILRILASQGWAFSHKLEIKMPKKVSWTDRLPLCWESNKLRGTFLDLCTFTRLKASLHGASSSRFCTSLTSLLMSAPHPCAGAGMHSMDFKSILVIGLPQRHQHHARHHSPVRRHPIQQHLLHLRRAPHASPSVLTYLVR